MSLTPASSSTFFATPTTTTSASPSPSTSSQPQPPHKHTAPSTLSTTPTASTPSFDFPREYHFPPFFTRQSNLTTLHSQLEKWSALVLGYCRYHRLYRLSLSSSCYSYYSSNSYSNNEGGGGGAAHEDLFRNRRLNRRLPLADAREVLDFMRREGRAEPVGGGGGFGSSRDRDDEKDGGDVFWVYWRTPEEWAGLVEDWVEETAQKGTVLTLYELTEGEGTKGTEFHGLDPDLLQKALQILVKRGKAQIFGQEDQQGVKFF
ncbi:ESCRT-II complex, vps25 subunit [Hypoxylon rubiginosum]|uniref:ESCRT-II complex, vps25 subunit n=1 Tax=Hypoxylon rubiginosum TaxID=110542 RepID=A0ACB9ZHB0_9PEZI|nr:ESCRT-II complex, vps25 subunit [Hypoxylon rubiginosum]